MDNNFNQQFAQNIKNQPLPSPVKESNSSKLPLIVAIILAVVLLFESIALVAIASNYSVLANELYLQNNEEDTEEEIINDVNSDYVFDKNNNLIAINIECKSENGSSLAFSTSNSYKSYDAANQSTTSGTYTITRDSIIQLSGPDSKTVLYDGTIIADGTTIYECEENLDEGAADTE